jgi:penicillin-binding protein 1A
LGVSDGEFPEPSDMTINLDCTAPVEDPNKPKDIDDDLEDLDF